MDETINIQCYNKGCGVMFDKDTNNADSCSYHPGQPVFHDAFKGWSCCNQKSTDFTTFLNMPGCTKGRHNPEKPIEPVKEKCEPLKANEVIVVNSQPKIIKTPRGDLFSPMTCLQLDVSQSLKNILDAEKENTDTENVETSSMDFKIGRSCENNGCKATFEGEESSLENCRNHPGFPIFHEGLKYWSCCKRKTTDFNSFLEQRGCFVGSHLWHKKNVKKTNCRYDWHQTSSHVIMTIYAKNSSPESTVIEVNQIRLRTSITFGVANSFEIDSELTGIIDPSHCSVMMFPSKVEVKMSKGEALHWKELFVVAKEVTKEEKANAEIVDASLDVNAIDLNDI